jgi:hypothetical protein
MAQKQNNKIRKQQNIMKSELYRIIDKVLQQQKERRENVRSSLISPQGWGSFMLVTL